MKRVCAMITLLCALFFASNGLFAQGKGPLPRSTPEAEGVSSEAIAALIADLDQNIDAMNSLMILRHGKVIAECWWAPHTPETTHVLYSLTKSFTSTAIGFAVAEGKLNVTDKVIDFFPEEVPADASDNLKNMTIDSLLSMSCGHETEAGRPAEGTWTKAFLSHPVPFEPGTHFRYNTPGSYMLSAILQKVTGKTACEWLQPRFFEPLGIETPLWEKSPDGVNLGGQGIFCHTEDIAKFGQFYLQKGEWDGKQLLPKEWVEEATRKHISNGTNPESDWNQGYGYQFWRCRHNIYRGDGAHCQYIVVVPDKDMVIVSTADSNDYQKILDLYWDYILPAAGDSPLPENPEALENLKKAEAGLVAKPGFTESGVMENLTIDSKILGRKVAYSVYFPKGYITFGGPWKTLYLLHGYSDDNSTWINPERGKLKESADKFFAEHPDKKRIVICPDGKISWYMDNADGTELYEKFMSEELIPAIDAKFRTAPGRENRAVAGLSMGGYGSLLWTLKHPELFSDCYAISAAVWTEDGFKAVPEDVYTELFNNCYGKPGPDGDRVTETYKKNDIFRLIQDFPEEYKGNTRFFLDCGDDDILVYANSKLFENMRQSGFSVEYRVRNGNHNWDHFSTALPTLFDFLR